MANEDTAIAGMAINHTVREALRAPDLSPSAKKMNQLSALVAEALRPDTEDTPIHATTFGYDERQAVEKAYRDVLNGRPHHCSISYHPESWDELGARFTPERLREWARNIYTKANPYTVISDQVGSNIDQLAKQVDEIVQTFVKEQNLALMLGRPRAA